MCRPVLASAQNFRPSRSTPAVSSSNPPTSVRSRGEPRISPGLHDLKALGHDASGALVSEPVQNFLPGEGVDHADTVFPCNEPDFRVSDLPVHACTLLPCFDGLISWQLFQAMPGLLAGIGHCFDKMHFVTPVEAV